MTSFIPQVVTVNDPKWYGNGLRFATEREALHYCIDLQSRWRGCLEGMDNRRAQISNDPVTHTWSDAGLGFVEGAA